MATSVISNTVTDGSGTAVPSFTVVATLQPIHGFRLSVASQVATRLTTTANASGAWSLTLERNADVTPSGTWWEIEQQLPISAGGPTVDTINVGASNQNLVDARTTPVLSTGFNPALLASLIDAKGDLLAGLSADVADNLPIGSTQSHALLVDSTTAHGMRWGAISIGALGLGWRNVIVDYGATGGGVSDDRTAISNADVAAGTAPLYFPPGTYRIASNLTLNRVCIFAEGAKLKPDAGITVTISGSVDAGPYQIFDLAAANAKVTWTLEAAVIDVKVEWWGVVPNDSTQAVGNANTTAFNKLFKDLPGSTTAGSVVRLQAGRQYYITNEVQVLIDSITIIGYGAELIARRDTWQGSVPNPDMTSGESMLSLGHEINHPNDIVYPRVFGLRISYDSAGGVGKFARAGVRIRHATFAELHHVRIGSVALAGIYIGNNNNVTPTIEGCHTQSCDYGIYFNGDQQNVGDASAPNILRIVGGKHHTHAKRGLFLKGMSGLILESVDFSHCVEGATYLENVGFASYREIYTERMGGDPPPDPNLSKVHHFKGCGRVKLAESNVNASNSQTGITFPSPKYGVYLEACADVVFETTTFLGGWESQVFADADCDRVVVRQSCRDIGTTARFVTGPPRCHLLGSNCVVESSVDTMQLRERRAKTVTNNVPSPCILSNWTTLNGAAIVGSSWRGPDGGTADSFTVFNATGGVIYSDTPVIAGTAGVEDSRVLRLYLRLISSAAQTKETREIKVQVWRSTGEILFVGSIWPDKYPGIWEMDFTNRDNMNNGVFTDNLHALPGADHGYRVRVEAYPNTDDMEIGVYGVQIAPPGTPYFFEHNANTAYAAKAAYGELVEGPLGLLYNGERVRVISTTASPQTAALSAAHGDSVWRVGDLAINSAPSAGEAWGWRCTVQGAPGTWEPQFALIGSPTTYTPTNVTIDRSFDANAAAGAADLAALKVVVEELADVLGTVITDQQSRGVFA